MNDKAVIDALFKIATYQRGGVVVTGEASGDRDEMIGLARQALKDIGYHNKHPAWTMYYNDKSEDTQ